MSFLELLKKSREEAKQHIQQITNKIVEEKVIENKIDIIHKEFNNEQNIIQNDNIIINNNALEDLQETPVLIQTQQINKSITYREKLKQDLTNAYAKKKKLYHKDKFAKHCYRLLNENRLSFKDFDFCFKNIQGLNSLTLDFKLLGGETMLEIQKYLNNKLTLEEVLSKKVGE